MRGLWPEVFQPPRIYLGLASPLELLNFVSQAELSPPSSKIKMTSSVICPKIPPGEGRRWMWAVVFSSDLTVLQLLVPWHGPACPAHLGWLIPALVTLQQLGDVLVSPAVAPKSPGLAAKRGLSGHYPEPQPSLQSCFPELCWSCWAPGDPSGSGQSRVGQDSEMFLHGTNQNPAVLVPGGGCPVWQGCPAVARHREMAPPAPSTSWHPSRARKCWQCCVQTPFLEKNEAMHQLKQAGAPGSGKSSKAALPVQGLLEGSRNSTVLAVLARVGFRALPIPHSLPHPALGWHWLGWVLGTH